MNLQVGTVITLTTRYKNDYILSDEKFKDTTYENVTVLSPEPWMKSNQVKISSDTPRMPFRVIDMRNIHAVNDELAEPFVSSIKEIEVAGSKGAKYIVTVDDGTAVSCTCPGYTFRGKCRHLAEVTE